MRSLKGHPAHTHIKKPNLAGRNNLSTDLGLQISLFFETTSKSVDKTTTHSISVEGQFCPIHSSVLIYTLGNETNIPTQQTPRTLSRPENHAQLLTRPHFPIASSEIRTEPV